MDALQDMLKGRLPQEPADFAAVKTYVQETFRASCKVSLHGEALVITVGSSSLANMLRLRTTALQAVCSEPRRLLFRIG